MLAESAHNVLTYEVLVASDGTLRTRASGDLSVVAGCFIRFGCGMVRV